MEIYILKGRVFENEYTETVIIYDQMEEKSKTYMGHHKKINKDRIGVVETGSFLGSFQIVLTDIEDIPAARKNLKDAVHEYNQKQFTEYQEKMIALEKHSLESEVKLKYENE